MSRAAGARSHTWERASLALSLCTDSRLLRPAPSRRPASALRPGRAAALRPTTLARQKPRLLGPHTWMRHSGAHHASSSGSTGEEGFTSHQSRACSPPDEGEELCSGSKRNTSSAGDSGSGLVPAVRPHTPRSTQSRTGMPLLPGHLT